VTTVRRPAGGPHARTGRCHHDSDGDSEPGRVTGIVVMAFRWHLSLFSLALAAAAGVSGPPAAAPAGGPSL
jgi:hypothetical protein